jgi:hypothetical protein
MIVNKIIAQANTPVIKRKITSNSIIANPPKFHGCLFSIGRKNPLQVTHGGYQI